MCVCVFVRWVMRGVGVCVCVCVCVCLFDGVCVCVCVLCEGVCVYVWDVTGCVCAREFVTTGQTKRASDTIPAGPPLPPLSPLSLSSARPLKGAIETGRGADSRRLGGTGELRDNPACH